ncbi:hypothetical protein C2E25_04180 [Geothermobacter hydrogeniphilus]|uniref:Uncharacterized protein n=1 Tax=Geothermobacter hydrogeniphilus TaxID=1969733 RepID=A0A2K2HCJ9_9BACT|nr:ankyrin repeat domain-containing protein [Geothermobacter hydrogeniphilus]PNU21007.1 hypothetical protein C2E25_04180 [Geothermobacter hydrogeniphilus]
MFSAICHPKRVCGFLLACLLFSAPWAVEAQQQTQQTRQALAAEIDKNLPSIPPEKEPSTADRSKIRPQLWALLDEIAASPQSDISSYTGRIIALARGDVETTRIVIRPQQNKDVALLLLAVKYDHVALLKRLLGKYPDYRQLAGEFIFDYPITLAVHNGSFRAARLLLESWGLEQLSDLSGPSPLVEAVKTGSAEMVQVLLDNGLQWEEIYDGDPVVMAMSLGYPKVARVFMIAQGVTRLSTEQTNEIFSKAMDYPPHIAVAEAMVDFISEADPSTLFYAAALDNEKIALKLCSLPGIDAAAPTRASYFNEVDSRGKTAAEVARAFGHQHLADQIRAKVEQIAAERLRLVEEQRRRQELEQRRQELEQRRQVLQQFKAEQSRNRKQILARETPYSGPLRTTLYFIPAGAKGRVRGRQEYVVNAALSTLAEKIDSYPLRFQVWERPTLMLYVRQKKGFLPLSAVSNEVHLYADGEDLFSFSFRQRGDAGIEGIAPILLKKLKEEIDRRPELFKTLVAQRDQREIVRTTKLRQERERQHKETMIRLRTMVRDKNYAEAVKLIDQLEQQGLYQSDGLGFIKATLLHKAGRDAEARQSLERYLFEYADSGSKYLAKAEALRRELEKKP